VENDICLKILVDDENQILNRRGWFILYPNSVARNLKFKFSMPDRAICRPHHPFTGDEMNKIYKPLREDWQN